MTLEDDLNNPVELEPNLESAIQNTIFRHIERLKERAKGCGCKSCNIDYQKAYDWYMQTYSRNLQLEIDDPKYAHPYDYIGIHLAEFPEDDTTGTNIVPYE